MTIQVARLLTTIVFSAALCSSPAARCAEATPGAGREVAEAAPAATPLGWLTMPKVTLPKLTMPKLEMPKMPADPLAPFKTGAHKVTDGAKKAWEGTKDIFTIGNGAKPTPGTPPSAQQQPLWKRMFTTAEEPPKKEGPQTVAEFMSQPRLDP